MTNALVPFDLSWGDVDPRQHRFDAGSALAVISGLDPAGRVPLRPQGSAGDPAVIAWSYHEGEAWATTMTQALVDCFGSWAAGWRWARDEGDLGGGPVGSWCCPRDSITTPAETLHRVRDALCEWRDWLEDLAERFDRFPLDAVPAKGRRHLWERATAHLVTAVVDQTGAGDAWYSHCRQVLTWFLTHWGVDPETARIQVERAVGGKFESWVQPGHHVVDDVAARLAALL